MGATTGTDVREPLVKPWWKRKRYYLPILFIAFGVTAGVLAPPAPVATEAPPVPVVAVAPPMAAPPVQDAPVPPPAVPMQPAPIEVSTLDEAARAACDSLAYDIRDGAINGDVTKRMDTARMYNYHVNGSNNALLVDSGDVLARGANASTNAWSIALDTAAQRCIDAGWTSN